MLAVFKKTQISILYADLLLMQIFDSLNAGSFFKDNGAAH
jgi:hypothetical protein